MCNVIITGGAGFIGSHTTDELVRRGYRVLVIDNLSSGKREHLNAHAEFVKMDILDESLAEVFIRFKPEVVIHLAAQVSVANSIKEPSHDAHINILGTLNILKSCESAGVKKLIYASSAAVYGMPESERVNELHAVRPVSFYGISKHTPEHYLYAYAKLFGLDYTVLRYANVFGDRQDASGEGGAVSIFAAKLLSGESPVIYGNGEQTRDFIYVGDIAQANVAAMDRGSGLTMNISGNRSTSINNLLRMMCNICARPFAPNYLPQRQGDVMHSLLDNGLAVRELGWVPKYSLQEGLIKTIDYYKTLRPWEKTAGPQDHSA